MNSVKPVKGLDWNVGAIRYLVARGMNSVTHALLDHFRSTGEFGGVLLKDVLEYAGLKENEIGVNHIHFIGLDSDSLTGEVREKGS